MEKRIYIFISAMILSFAFLVSCDDMFDDRINGNNKIITESRDISNFDEIIMSGNFDVYTTIEDTFSLKISAEENLIPFIITKVSGKKLYIETKENYNLNNSRAMKIFLTTTNLEGVRLTGSGIISCDSLTTEFLGLEISDSGKIDFKNLELGDIDCEISGSGDIIVSGNSDRSDLKITGSGAIRSLDLKQENCESEITGSGNIFTNVTDKLRVRITGTGSVFYSGNPEINKNITGVGKVQRY